MRTKKFFIKTTTTYNTENKEANPPSATNMGVKNNVLAKNIKLYIKYLEDENERQIKFIKEAFLNINNKK